MKKYLICISFVTVSAFIVYEIKTAYNGDTLGKDYWITAIILICTQVPFYFSESKDKSITIESDE